MSGRADDPRPLAILPSAAIAGITRDCHRVCYTFARCWRGAPEGGGHIRGGMDMTPPRPCIGCGALTQRSRCPRCEQQHQSQRNQRRSQYQGGWQTQSAKARAEWVAEHGWVCPGFERPAHPATTLQLDHTTGLVLCHRCNVAAGPAHHPGA